MLGNKEKQNQMLKIFISWLKFMQLSQLLFLIQFSSKKLNKNDLVN